MSENLRQFLTGAGVLRNVVTRVPADAWDNPSCCEGWSAREVAGHITWGLETLGNMAEGGEVAPDRPEAEWAGDDPAARVRAAVDSAIAKLDRPDTLQRTMGDFFGGMSVDGFCALMGMDTLVHAWDIADATGIDPGIDQPKADWTAQRFPIVPDDHDPYVPLPG